MRVFLRHMIVAAVLAGSVPAIAAEPVRQVGIYVQPFYEAARSPGERPRVAVGKQYNDLLSSSRREDILAARDLIVAKPALVTPMTNGGVITPAAVTLDLTASAALSLTATWSASSSSNTLTGLHYVLEELN